ncbi:MAG: hypothetical protein V2B20_14165 [Pseudomonadota bacterium]
MKPHLRDDATPPLVAARSDRTNIEKLDAFPLWHDSTPQPLE